MVRLVQGPDQIDTRTPPPGTTTAPNPLADFLQHSRPPSRVQVRLPGWLRRSIWVIASAVLLWAIWLITIMTGAIACDGYICAVATLDRHAAVLLVFAAVCLTGLVALAITTRGLSRGNGREMAGLGAAVAVGGAALIGIVALVVGAAIVLMIFEAFFAALTASS